jgi:hypothetical protein
MAVCRELRSIGQPVANSGDKIVDRRTRAIPDFVANDELRLTCQCRPGPDLTRSSWCSLGFRHVFLFGVAERPDFVKLNVLGRNVDYVLAMVYGACFGSLNEQLRQVLIDTSSKRLSDHVDMPSTSAECALAPLCVLSLFIPSEVLIRMAFSRHYGKFSKER